MINRSGSNSNNGADYPFSTILSTEAENQNTIDSREFPYNIRQQQLRLQNQESNPANPENSENPKSSYEQIQDDLEKLQDGYFIKHLLQFVLVGGILTLIWLFTGRGFPWFLIPIGGMGIGFFTQFARWKCKIREKKELLSMPQLLEKQRKAMKKFHRNRRTMVNHGATAISVSGFLLLLNAITPPISWSLIPVSILMLIFILRIPHYLNKHKQGLRELEKLGLPIQNISSLKVYNPIDIQGNSQSVEIENLRVAICNRLKKLGDEGYPGADSTVNHFVDKILDLIQTESEISKILSQTTILQMNQELSDLQQELEATTNHDLRQELARSIQSLEKQLESCKTLDREHQLLKAKINSSINSLKQLNLNLTGIQKDSIFEGLDNLTFLTKEIEDLNVYYKGSSN